MNSWWLLLGLPAGIAAAWVFVRRKPVEDCAVAQRELKNSGPVKATRNEPVGHGRHYYGASIQISSNPCEAARAIANKRYLTEQTPRFPLPECDRSECRCKVIPQDDRRAGYDRRGDSFSAYGNFEPDSHTQKRQKKTDRRHSS